MNASTQIPRSLLEVPKATAGGCTLPRCIYCPRADYASEALIDAWRVVDLVYNVGEDAGDGYRVAKACPGLDAER